MTKDLCEEGLKSNLIKNKIKINKWETRQLKKKRKGEKLWGPLEKLVTGYFDFLWEQSNGTMTVTKKVVLNGGQPWDARHRVVMSSVIFSNMGFLMTFFSKHLTAYCQYLLLEMSIGLNSAVLPPINYFFFFFYWTDFDFTPLTNKHAVLNIYLIRFVFVFLGTYERAQV